MVDVPCNGCTLCCRSSLIPLQPQYGDVVEDYDRQMVMINGDPKTKFLALAHGPDGNCVYLKETGCSIHERAPYACRVFDCRQLFRQYDRSGRRRMIRQGFVSKETFVRGRELLEGKA